jgi:Tfp pilus assembly protein PilV
MKRSRRGSMFLEVCVAMVVASVAFVAISRLLAVSGRQRHVMELEHRARSIAANTMEQVMAMAWDDLTREKLQPKQKSAEAESLPDGTVQIDVVEHAQPAAREIQVRVQWRRPDGTSGRPAQLTAWRFHSERPAP